jgi:hypothetical protein
MELRKTSPVDALNRTGARSVLFGTRLFGGGGRTVSSPRADSTGNGLIGVDSAAAAPPKAKIPSWYRNLHHSLLSMDGDSDDDDDDNDKGIDDQPFEKKMDRSRRTASVDIDIDLESTERRQPRGSTTGI